MTERLLVIGGGITGLAAAYEASADGGREVTLLEASERLGGKVRTTDVVLDDGTALRIDEGADAFLARVPDAVGLCRELGLTEQLTQPAVGRAKVYAGGRLRFLPDDTVLGVPLDAERLEAAGILSEQGLARAVAEADHRGPPPSTDVAIGPFLSEHFGPELVERIVGPLIGGINAGDIDRLSLAAVTPQLADAAVDGDSLTRALRRRRSAEPVQGPVFHGLLGGTERLIDALVQALTERGVKIQVSSPAAPIESDHDTSVVVATPAPAAARLLDVCSPAAAAELDQIEHSSVTLVTFVFEQSDVATDLDASGFLVPRDSGLLMTAASWGSSKWAHWDDGRHVVLRVSAGRTGDERQMTLDDDSLVTSLRDDLDTTMGITAPPVGTRVSRWPLGFAQYTVGHLERVARIEAALVRDCPSVRVAGAAYRGLGLPACIRQGRQAARSLLA